MDGPPVSFDYVATDEHGRSYMSNRVINQLGVPGPTLAMRANVPVFNTEDGQYKNRVACHFEQPLYTPYSTPLDLCVPPSDHLSNLRLPDLTAFGSCPTNASGGRNASDLAFKPGWSGPAHFKFQANEGWAPLCRMLSA
jgi:hypothetical protein